MPRERPKKRRSSVDEIVSRLAPTTNEAERPTALSRWPPTNGPMLYPMLHVRL
jgi:hypothetical protein